MYKFAIYTISFYWAVNYSFFTYAQGECKDSIFLQNFETSFKTGDYIQVGDTLLDHRLTYIGDSLAVVLFNGMESEAKNISVTNNIDKSGFIKSSVLYIQYDINDKLKYMHVLLNPKTMESVVYHFHSNGMISSILPFRQKHRNGKYISFYDNGIVESFGNYFNGTEEGLWVEYHNNGVKKSEGCFKLGYDEKEGFYFSDMDGYWYEYDENEKLIKKTLYKKGVIIQEEKLELKK